MVGTEVSGPGRPTDLGSAPSGAVYGPLRARPHAGRIRDGVGTAAGLLLVATGVATAALLPGLAGLLAAAMTIGAGTALITPIGFAHLAATTPAERLGQTLGSAANSATPAARCWSAPSPPPAPPASAWPGWPSRWR